MTRLVVDVLAFSPAMAPTDVELRRRMQQLELSQPQASRVLADRSTGSDSGTLSFSPSDVTLVSVAVNDGQADEEDSVASRRAPERNNVTMNQPDKEVKVFNSITRLREKG